MAELSPFERRLAQFRAMAEPTRLRLLRVLRSSELTVTELTAVTGQSQPGVSRHLKLLCDAALVARHQEGAWVFYRATLPADLCASLDGAEDAATRADDDRLRAVLDDRRAAAARYFAAHADGWDALRAATGGGAGVEDAIREVVAAAARAAGGTLDRVIDLGTGTARMLVLLDGLYGEGIGLDASAEMLAVARANIHEASAVRARVRRADLFALGGVEDARDADVVILHHVLHYLSDPGGAVAAAAACLAPGGTLLVADMAPHEREDLRAYHAHRRLGFSDQEVAGWAAAAGMRAATTRSFATADPAVTAKLWRLDRPAPPPAAERRERARANA